MRVTTVTCDRCKQVIETDMSTVALDAIGVIGQRLDGKVDLCERCAESLFEWLRSKPSGEKASCP